MSNSTRIYGSLLSTQVGHDGSDGVQTFPSPHSAETFVWFQSGSPLIPLAQVKRTDAPISTSVSVKLYAAPLYSATRFEPAGGAGAETQWVYTHVVWIGE